MQLIGIKKRIERNVINKKKNSLRCYFLRKEFWKITIQFFPRTKLYFFEKKTFVKEPFNYSRKKGKKTTPEVDFSLQKNISLAHLLLRFLTFAANSGCFCALLSLLSSSCHAVVSFNPSFLPTTLKAHLARFFFFWGHKIETIFPPRTFPSPHPPLSL